MKLALKCTAAASAGWWDRFVARLIRWRLCSQYCHAGIVLGEMLLQCNPEHGLHATTDFERARWVLIDLGPAREKEALALFDARMNAGGAGYDWLGVLGFALPWVRSRASERLYCFEWCAIALGAPRALADA